MALGSALLGGSLRVQDFLELFLRQDSGEPLVAAMMRNLRIWNVFGGMFLWALVGLTLAGVITALVAWRARRSAWEVLPSVARAFVVAFVPAIATGAALLSLSIAPTFPYGMNLAVTLALEGPFLMLLTAALFVAALTQGLVPVSGARDAMSTKRRFVPAAVVLAAMLLFVLATPTRFYRDGEGQGNMFKYVRMAAAVAASGSLDIRQAEGADERATLSSFLGSLPSIVGTYVRESGRLVGNILGAAAEGKLYTGELRASRGNRSIFRSVGGGNYYINAPGPGLLLVPAYLVDRYLNRWLGTRRQLSIIVFWQFLSALLVLEMVRASEELAGIGAAATTAFSVAASVPVLFYSFQIYPELPAALLLLFAFRKLVMDPMPATAGVLAASMALAFLPWLHQKYSVTSVVLAIYATSRFLRREAGRIKVERSKLLVLGLPLAFSAYSIFLYNHALTGSLSPRATFDAAARSSFEPLNALSGLGGLLFDRENGLFVFAPIYLLALVGASRLRSEHHRLCLPLLLTLASYVAVVASFPYWPGAVSTMARYILSILPFLTLPIALVVRRSFRDGALAGTALALAAAAWAYSLSFVKDLVPSYGANLLWSRVLYSDPNQYLPDFLGESFTGVEALRLGAALLGVSLLVLFARRRLHRQGGPPDTRFPSGLVVGASGFLLVVNLLAAIVELVPANASTADKPTFRETLTLSGEREISVFGVHGFERGGVWIPGGGESRFVLVSSRSLPGLLVEMHNGPERNIVELREEGGDPLRLALSAGGPHRARLSLGRAHTFTGPRGERFVYQIYARSRGSFVPADDGLSEDHRRLGVFVRFP